MGPGGGRNILGCRERGHKKFVRKKRLEEKRKNERKTDKT